MCYICRGFRDKSIMLTSSFWSLHREDRSQLNRILEAVKTNFNDRFDEVRLLASVVSIKSSNVLGKKIFTTSS